MGSVGVGLGIVLAQNLRESSRDGALSDAASLVISCRAVDPLNVSSDPAVVEIGTR